ncbi:MAG: DivIVA domain-containing protein, partial [Actinomycetota bacterium]
MTPEEIEGKEFGVSRRGYDRDEVDEFLVEVAGVVRDAEAAAASAPEPGSDDSGSGDSDSEAAADDPGSIRARLAGGDDDTDDFGRLGAEVALVLRTADEAATKRRSEAEAESE